MSVGTKIRVEALIIEGRSNRGRTSLACVKPLLDVAVTAGRAQRGRGQDDVVLFHEQMLLDQRAYVQRRDVDR